MLKEHLVHSATLQKPPELLV
uniref:Uncharacterized protein n=1 Tax=Moniliophthora roreri TaxID=221103 RepID=A0A0W0FTD1_MONRR